MDQKWQKSWKIKLWPKISIFSWLVMKNHILTSENLKKRGMQGAYQCCLFEKEKESMNHLLDECSFVLSIWDRRAFIFCLTDRVRGHPDQTIKKWNLEAFPNPIMRALCIMFSGFLFTVVWKEQNNRIFQDKSSNE